MPGPTSAIIAAKKIPWTKVIIAGQFAYRKGSAGAKALTPSERSRLLELLRKSQGRPNNLTERERHRIRELAGKVLAAAREA